MSDQLPIKPDATPLFYDAQQALFCEFPEQPQLIENVKEFIHTGKIAQKYPHVEEVLRAVLNRVPYRAICRQFHIGFETVKKLYDLAEQSGKLRTLQKHMADEWAEIHGLTMWRLREKLLAGTMPAQSLPVLGGIATQNFQLLTGSPTEIVSHKKDAANLTVESIRDMMDKLPRANGTVIDVPAQVIADAPTDSESTVSNAKGQ